MTTPPPASSAAATPSGDPSARPVEAPPLVGAVVADSVDVSSELGGTIRRISVRPGERVSAGLEVAVVEPLDLGRQLAGAEAGADAAEAEARRAQTEVTIADDRAARVERAPELFSSEERSRAAAEREGARHALEVARARAAQATAEWQRLEEQWAHRLIRSPFEGFVAARFYDPGVVVGVGEPLLRLIRSDRYLLRFAVPPAEASGWQVGSCLTATIRDSHHDFSATVARIAPQVDPASQLVFAEADLEPETLAGESLQHGQVVDVRPCPGIGQK